LHICHLLAKFQGLMLSSLDFGDISDFEACVLPQDLKTTETDIVFLDVHNDYIGEMLRPHAFPSLDAVLHCVWRSRLWNIANITTVVCLSAGILTLYKDRGSIKHFIDGACTPSERVTAVINKYNSL